MPQVGSISIIGTDHLENKENNQDSISCDDLGHCQLIIAADGAGSAKKSYIGSQKLITRLNDSLKKLSKSQLKFPVQNKNIIEKNIINTIEDLRKDLLAHAKDNSIPLKETKEQKGIFSKIKNTINSVPELFRSSSKKTTILSPEETSSLSKRELEKKKFFEDIRKVQAKLQSAIEEKKVQPQAILKSKIAQKKIELEEIKKIEENREEKTDEDANSNEKIQESINEKVNGNINSSSDKNNSIINEKTDEELLWDYASTLVMIIAGESETLVFHIGDGFAGIAKLEKKDNEEKFSVSSQEISEPVNGEYENETRFFVEKNWRENLRVKEIKGDYNFFIVMTDGADPFVINSKRDGLVEMIVTTIYSASISKDYESLDFILSKVFPIEKVQSLQTDDASISIIVRP